MPNPIDVQKALGGVSYLWGADLMDTARGNGADPKSSR